MEPGDDSAAGWRLHVLGGVPWLERGAERLVPDRRTAALLALLAFGGPMSRERAAGLLWPDRPADRARANLRQLLYRLRADADVLEDAPLALRGDVAVDADLVGEQPWVLDGPIEPMRGHDLAGMDEVAERMHAAAARLHARIRADLAAVATEREQQGDLPAATDAARALAALDPLDEAAARLTMRLLLASGEPAAALATFARTRETLHAEVGVGPAPETVALARARGPDAPGTRAAVAHIAADPRAAAEIRAAARGLAAAWGVATEPHPEDGAWVHESGTEEGPDGGVREGRAGAAGAWQALVEELMTPA